MWRRACACENAARVAPAACNRPAALSRPCCANHLARPRHRAVGPDRRLPQPDLQQATATTLYRQPAPAEQAGKRFQKAKKPQEANMALACQEQWLEHWAQAGALLDPDASNTGMAARKRRPTTRSASLPCNTVGSASLANR
ncbi:hypothetical protein WR25_09274 [Diploscapter pachys]|uniref:Uncharacterized protein n=1 Tax=Diploscapter pachys TaxID=2018661 RepID=A0A2A2M4T2_9BILA|nr:hypothetical protein WR25_09274 [Diploscapter pachys]